MTNSKLTKKALLTSVMALFLCVAMLTGTTFAWFTDTVTSSGNIIKAGTLDVTMEWADGAKAVPADDSTDWTDASTGAIFNYDKWEPGYVSVRHIKIANEGDLALKYQLSIVANGDVSKLADVIDVYYLDPADQIDDRDELTADKKLGTLTEVLANISNTASGELKVAEKHTITLALKMQESADNNYQNLSIGSDFAVQLVATQLAYESDSIDDQYDVESDYVAEVKTADALATALKAGGLVKLASDISVEETLTVPAGVAVELDLNGMTITGIKGRDADNKRIHVLVNNGILTINDGTVKSAGNDGGSAICNNEGANLTINDVVIYGAPQSDPVYEAGVSKPFPSYAFNNYGDAVVNGATVKSYHGAIATGANGTTVINDADIDVGLGQSTGITSYLIYSYDNAQVTVNGGTFAFTKQEIKVNGGNTFCELGTNPIIVNGGNYIGTSFSTGADREYVINAGTFDKDPTAYAKGQVVENGDGTWTVKPYEVSTAADLADKLANGNPVVLTSDVALTSKLYINQDAYIDGNGKTIKFTSGSSDRFIDVPKEAVGADLTIKNVVIDIDGSYCQRGINYNTNGTLILDNVTLTGTTKATYGINLPSGSANATVEMNNCDITALIALNIWGENVVVNVKDCNLSNYDNNSTEGENYATVKLNNDGTYAAEGSIITITGGTITAKDESGADFIAVNNNTATGAILISDSTVVNGITATNVAIIRYRDGNGNFYNEFYGSTILQSAVTLAAKTANAEVFLLTDITVDTLDVPANVTLHKNGHELNIGATTGSGILNIVD